MDNGQVTGDAGNAEFTMREWEQAWAHTRHLESMRGQYLGFFFTAVLGVTAIAGPSLADDSLRSPASLLTVSTLALGLQLTTGFIYLAVVRLNEVLGYYLRIILVIKAWMLSNGAAADLGPYATPPKPARPWAGTSGVSERVLQVGLSVFPLVLIGTLMRSIDRGGASVTTLACAMAAVLGAVVAVFVFLGGKGSTPLPPSSAPMPDQGEQIP